MKQSLTHSGRRALSNRDVEPHLIRLKPHLSDYKLILMVLQDVLNASIVTVPSIVISLITNSLKVAVSIIAS